MGHGRVVQVQFDDSLGRYAYFSGGLTLFVGDLVVTPRSSSGTAFESRYDRQGVATVVGYGRGGYVGSLKTLVGRVVTVEKPHEIELNEVPQTAALRPPRKLKSPADRRLNRLEDRVQQLEDRLDNDTHTHDGRTSPPRRVQRMAAGVNRKIETGLD